MENGLVLRVIILGLKHAHNVIKRTESSECAIIAFSTEKLIRGIFTLIIFQGFYPHATIKTETK
ncbi:hypothetical protein [Methanoplanus limicola]|uniref:hypothetical protein n=1 Tax=Methanoplanus limicola TaxID=2315 RepID=UPI0012F6928D|nr:hypothetical protein [Methanoplanus limicola]